MSADFLESTKKQFEYYKMLGDKTIEQLTENQLFWQYNAESNSVATIIKHLSGNMLSRWTDFLTTDGEKEWRNRDDEFVIDFETKTDLLQKWDEGWNCLFNTLNSLQEADFLKTIYIRNQGHSVIEAINRQLAHYPYHVGQMVYIAKMICDQNWVSLTIPKGNSNSYNTEKFSKEKHKEHFTNEFLNQKNSMDKIKLIEKLNIEHLDFWQTAVGLPNPATAVNNKWSVDENIAHISIILSKLNNYLLMPKSSIETTFGFCKRASKNYDAFIQTYLDALQNGVKAPATFIPEINSQTNTKQLVENGKELLEIFILNLEDWTEEELDSYNCKHPALGLITVREMLYFVVYHVHHHHLIIKRTS